MIRIWQILVLGAVLGVWTPCAVTIGQNRIRDMIHVDTLFPQVVSDTLNVQSFTVSSWVSSHKGEVGSNAVGGVQNYHPLYETSLIRNDLGNIGSASHIMLFDLPRDFGFSFRRAREGFWNRAGDRRILLSEKMFSNVQYSNGANRENYLVANLTRGFGQLLDLGFRFNRINSLGFYSQQTNTITDISVFSTFRTKNDRYRAALIFDYSNLLAQENGGIANDSVFENNLSTSRDFISVNLPQSSNHWKGFDLALEQRFFLRKLDSLSNSNRMRPAISHSFSAERHSFVYENVPDTASGFYENIFLDTTATYDSTNLLSIHNSLRFELVKSDSVGDKIVNRLVVGGNYAYHRVSYDSAFVDNINNVSVLADVDGKLFNKVGWNASGRLMLTGYNIWDFRVNGKFDYQIEHSRFEAFVDYDLFRPDYITHRYQSNHFVWLNDWRQTQHLKTGLLYEQERLRFKGWFTYHLIEGAVVYGEDRTPYQSGAVNQILVLRLQEHFKLRWFHIVLDGAVQWKMTGDDFRIPLALGRGLLYYQNDIFKKRLRLQVGVETSYATSYLANAYNPAVSDFHIQNTTEVGNYPFIDVFLNLRVKKLRAFVKFTHFNAGWLGYRYYHVPGYPVNDFAWKFGVNWAFLD